jgi:hypothetical protein
VISLGSRYKYCQYYDILVIVVLIVVLGYSMVCAYSRGR